MSKNRMTVREWCGAYLENPKWNSYFLNSTKICAGLLFLSIWLGIACSSSRPTTAPPDQTVATNQPAIPEAPPVPKSLLWKIEGNGIQPSYLFGTFHILPQKDFVLKDRVKSAFTASDQIVLELDMDDPSMQIEMMQNAAMKDGTTLDQLFTPEDYKKLDELLQANLGFGLQMFNSFKPFMISSMLIQNYIEGAPASFEGTFVQMAKEAKKEILGLESVTDQLSIFDEIPYEEQVEDIVDMLNDEDSIRDMYAKMIELYKAEDLEGIYQFTAEYFDDPQEEELLLNTRNKNWIPKIGELAREKSTFFGVGAAHLGGPNGVVELLKKANYTITAVE